MKQIGFKNFRKFAGFPPLDLAPITIFVGENNAGKSTVVKGILALSDFLNKPAAISIDEFDAFDAFDEENDTKDRAQKRKVITQKRLQSIKFQFNTSYLAHIGTFKRALYNRADNNAITFYTKMDNLCCSYIVKGDPQDEESVTGTLSNVNVSIDFFNVDLLFDLINDKATVKFNPNKDYHPTEQYKKRNLYDYYSSFDEPIVFDVPISDYWSIFGRDLVGTLIEAVENAINITLAPDNMNFKDIEGLGVLGYIGRRNGGKLKRLDISEKQKGFLKSFSNIFSRRNKDSNDEIGDRMERFNFPGAHTRSFMARNVDIEYLYAHAVTQTVIYSAKDTNDYLSRTIHQFASQKELEYKHLFIQKWMKEFGIGVDYKIKSVGGEAHLVHIVNHDGEEVNLADKGMGSIQLMVLLFRLAITLPSDAMLKAFRQDRIRATTSIIIIEEPEQNLHPMLQSKLADLLFELNFKYNFRFIIETHSEYLVRRSQVIVGDKFATDEKLKENPFKVYYFPSEGIPYDMVYTTSGLFEKKFGEGFINEAGKLHMAVLKNAQKQK